MTDKFLHSEIQNPDSFEPTSMWETIDFPNPEIAKEMEKRWNAFNQLKQSSEELKAKNFELQLAAKNAIELAWHAIKKAGYRVEISNEALKNGLPENAEITREDSTKFDGVIFKAKPTPDRFS